MREQDTKNRRDGERRPMEGVLTVRVAACEIEGSSQNVSPDGVYFTAHGSLPVEVELPDGTRRTGKIMRVGAVREGELGIALRFDEPLTDEELD